MSTWTPFKRAYLRPRTYVGRRPDLWYRNSRYVVAFWKEKGGFRDPVAHLSIRNRDRSTQRSWTDFQRIKNELCGPEYEAVELYPAESRLVDLSNQYHLWVFRKGALDWGFANRAVRSVK